VANNMGCMSQAEIEKFAAQVIRELNLDGWQMEWTGGGSMCEKSRHIIFIDKRWINKYPWQAKENVLHEIAHIFTEDKLHGLGFYREYIDLLERFMAV